MIRRVCQRGLGIFVAACVLGRLASPAGGQSLEQPEKKDVNSKDRALKPLKPEIKNEDLFKIESRIETSKKYAGRNNGVLLQAKAEVKKDGTGDVILNHDGGLILVKKGDVILIHWSIDYDGPRFPLHILKPSFDVERRGQTYLTFELVDDKGIAYPVALHAELPPLLTIADEQCFLTVNRGDVIRGTIEVPLQRVEVAARNKLVGKLSGFPPARLFVQLRHIPEDRAERFNLDAWTGALQTPLIPVPIERAAKD